jgi:UDP-N-acetylglucosamine/UDP-N-acetylgalactosamine diphosphorylase
VRQRFESHGQGHVFRFWDRLGAAERESLLAQAAAIDLSPLLEALAAHRARGDEVPPKLEPVRVERIPEHGGDPERIAEAARCGAALLADGRVGLLVVAGGQATRLGYEGPKGSFPIGPVSQRSLFEIQAQKIRGLRRRTGRPVPWYVMTSAATDAATRAFFAASKHFGLPPEDVFFFRQAMVPSFDFDDRLILETPGRIMQNPNGHGGSLTSLLDCGALDDMDRRGIDTLFYYQVDNPLVRIADPAFLGFHDTAGSEMSCKVVRKNEPTEKVGVLARANGRLGVVEYTELEDEHRFARNAEGDLLFWAGNTAIHVFATAFVRRIAAGASRLLPYHASEKKIPTVDDEGRPVRPEASNGCKLERFVFDALPVARNVCIVETARSEEYSPVKNAEGTDSPATARRDLIGEYRRWLDAAGIELPAESAAIELDHSRIDAPEEARDLGIRSAADAGDVIRIATGADR